jgi:hypothetical protein
MFFTGLIIIAKAALYARVSTVAGQNPEMQLLELRESQDLGTDLSEVVPVALRRHFDKAMLRKGR